MNVKVGIITAVIAFSGLATGFTVSAAVINNVIYPEALVQDPAVVSDYQINDNNETYGSSAKADSYADFPDLIEAMGNNGKIGYIRKEDLQDIEPKNPEEALRIQNERIASGYTGRIVNVYDKDGVTIIDTFTISFDPKGIVIE